MVGGSWTREGWRRLLFFDWFWFFTCSSQAPILLMFEVEDNLEPNDAIESDREWISLW